MCACEAATLPSFSCLNMVGHFCDIHTVFLSRKDSATVASGLRDIMHHPFQPPPYFKMKRKEGSQQDPECNLLKFSFLRSGSFTSGPKTHGYLIFIKLIKMIIKTIFRNQLLTDGRSFHLIYLAKWGFSIVWLSFTDHCLILFTEFQLSPNWLPRDHHDEAIAGCVTSYSFALSSCAQHVFRSQAVRRRMRER